MYIYPSDNPKLKTVMKKRTMIQPQRNKANVLDSSPKDYFISNGIMSNEQIMLIDGTNVSNIMLNGNIESLPLLPNSSHPYDHYMVYTELKF